MEFGYRARLPSSVVMGIAQRQAGAGAAIGAGLAQAGQVAARVAYDDAQVEDRIADSNSRIQQRELQRRRSEAIAVNSGALSELDLRMGQEITDARAASAPGAPGHAAKAEELYRKRGQEFLDSLPDDPVVREFFTPRVARFVNGGIAGEQVFERERRAKHIGEQTEKAVDRASALTYATPSFEVFSQNTTDLLSMIELQDDLDGTAKAAMKEAVRASQSTALLDGLIDKGGFDAAEEALNSGQFDAYIGGADGRARYLDRIGAGRDVQRRQAEAAANEAKRDALDRLKALEVLLDNNEVPSTSDINAALASAQAAGVDAADLLEFGFLADRAQRTKGVQGLTTRQIESQRMALQQKIDAGQADGADRRQFDALDDELGRRDDKASDELQGLDSEDIAVQAGALAQLRQMPEDRRMRVARKAGQPSAAILAGLDPRTQATTLRGRRVRAAKPEAFLPQTSRGALDKDALDTALLETIGPALQRQLLLGGHYESVRELALDFYVGSATQGGTGTVFNQEAFARAVNGIFGASRRADGTLQGGIGEVRGRRIELPPRWTGPEFDRRWSRLDFAGARYGDGTPAQKRDVLENYQPLLIGQNEAGEYLYVLQNDSGSRLAGEDGGDYRIRVKDRP